MGLGSLYRPNLEFDLAKSSMDIIRVPYAETTWE